MNTWVAVDGLVDLRPWIAEVAATLSRFDSSSPLSRLNGSPGRWIAVPDLLFRAIGAALQAASATAGAFDPTILDGLEAAGYSRSFEQGPAAAGQPRPAGRWREIRLDPYLRAVRLPPGVRLDLGGIGKGLAVDEGLARLWQAGRGAGRPRRALVNAGGDLALRTAPGEQPYLVDVEDPFRPERTLATFALHRGAAATSSVTGRCWGDGLHHIIDPRTGRPAQSGLAAATVFGPGAARAEVLAKAAIILGEAPALALIRRQGCHAVLVRHDGSITLSEGLEEYRHGTA